MKLMDVMAAPWAIMPEMLREIRGIYETHMRGDKIDIAGVEARLGRELNNQKKDIEIVDGVAIISAVGPVAKRMNLFMEISGGVSTEVLANQIEIAVEDNSVKAIILDIDSPGGTVDGTFELADRIFELRGTKPIVGFANGLMASAAYAFGAACDCVFVSGDTTTVGSIGVVATHVDVSEAEKRSGYVTTEIYAGKYKRISSQYAPLTTEGKASIQDGVDALYSVFVEKVSLFRDAPVSTVLEDMADGRLFIGQQVISAGLADGVSSIDKLITALAEGQDVKTLFSAGVAQLSENDVVDDQSTADINDKSKEEDSMDITKGYIEEHHADIAESFRAEGADTAKADGATAERQRIQDVFSQAMPGHDALINKLAFDGETTGPMAAVAVLVEEKKNKASALGNLQSDGKDVADVSASLDDDSQAVDDSKLPLEERCKATWDKDESLRAEFNDDYDSYFAYEKANAKGNVRILGNK